MESMMKLMQNGNIVGLITSAAILYSCGVLFYCIENNVNVSIFAYLLVIILSYQYKHRPITAKKRNLDEIWVCLLLNCGLPLFAYYMQLPEIENMDQLQSITQQQTEEEIINNILTEETIINDAVNDNTEE